MRLLKKGFVIVKADLLRVDCGTYAKVKQTNYSAICTKFGLSNGYISNSKDCYIRHCISNGLDRADIDFSLGIMNECILDDFCKAFELDKRKYTNEEDKPEEQDTSISDYSEKLDEMTKLLKNQIYLLTELKKSIDDIGRVSVDGMNAVKKIADSL